MTARLLTDLGVAQAVPSEATAQIGRALKKALADASLPRAAAAFAQRHAGYDQQSTIRSAAERCERLIGAAS